MNKFKYGDKDTRSIAAEVKLLDKGLTAYVYLNGGCYFEPSAECSSDNIKLVAAYKNDLNSYASRNKIAIVECTIGRGNCLLSGVHFEFDAHRLDSTNENVRLNLLDKLLASNRETYSLLSRDKNDETAKLKHSNHELVQYLLKNTFNI